MGRKEEGEGLKRAEKVKGGQKGSARIYKKMPNDSQPTGVSGEGQSGGRRNLAPREP